MCYSRSLLYYTPTTFTHWWQRWEAAWVIWVDSNHSNNYTWFCASYQIYSYLIECCYWVPIRFIKPIISLLPWLATFDFDFFRVSPFPCANFRCDYVGLFCDEKRKPNYPFSFSPLPFSFLNFFSFSLFSFFFFHLYISFFPFSLSFLFTYFPCFSFSLFPFPLYIPSGVSRVSMAGERRTTQSYSYNFL